MGVRFFTITTLLLAACRGETASTIDEHYDADTISEKPDGALLYQNNCASCHGSDGTLGASGARNLRETQMGKEKMLDLLEKGKGVMPPFKDLIPTEEERQAVVDYVLEFKEDEE